MKRDVVYRHLELSDIKSDMLRDFIRHQEVTDVYFYKNGQRVKSNNPFTEIWGDDEKAEIVVEMRASLESGGTLIGAYSNEKLIGFASVDGAFIGSEGEYLKLDLLYISSDFRGLGLGRMLFRKCVDDARKAGAKKLYISSQCSVETVEFYSKVGCVDATWIYQKQVELEPYDYQFEYVIKNMKFIGIDLAWTYKNETGVCVIDESGRVEFLDSQVYSDEAILSIIKEYSGDGVCIAIDAPLILNNEEGAREADRLLVKNKIHGHTVFLFMANRRFFMKSYGSVRGETLTALIQKEIPAAEFNEIAVEGKVSMVETFPTAICCGLFPEIYPVKYKVKHKTPYEESKRQLVRILKRLEKIEKIEGRVYGLVDKLNVNHLEITKKTHKHIEDQLDAFLSAYSLFTIYKGYANQKSFGDYKDGFITIPIIDSEHELSQKL